MKRISFFMVFLSFIFVSISPSYTEKELLKQLLEIKDQKERAEILKQNELHITVELIDSIILQAVKNVNENFQDDALALLEIAKEMAEFIHETDKQALCEFNQGQIYLKTGNLLLAKSHYELALLLYEKTGNAYGRATVYQSLGELYAQEGENNTALFAYKQAIEHFSSSLSWYSLGWAYLGAARVYQKLGKMLDAYHAYKSAIENVEKIRKVAGSEKDRIAFLEDRLIIYKEMIELLLSLENPPEEPFNYLEKVKARALLDMLQYGEFEGSASNKALKDMLQKETSLVLGGKEPYTLKDIQQKVLDKDTALFMYLVNNHKIYNFVITQNDHFVTQVGGKDSLLEDFPLREQISSFLEPMYAYQSNPFLKHKEHIRLSKILYDELLSEALTKIKKGTTLIIIPDAELNLLPFHALISDEGDETLDTAAFVIEDYPIVYAPSATVVALEKEKGTTPSVKGNFLAFADPYLSSGDISKLNENTQDIAFSAVLRGNTLQSLPHSRDEVMRIGELYKGKGKIYVGSNALEENVKQNVWDYTYIHFATHGLLNQEHPLLSGIVFSELGLRMDKQKVSEDGILTAQEILSSETLKISSDLVVLSACETGRGEIKGGEGVIGLTRAFILAGARSVVVSLWSVADQSTAELMVQFYKNLKEKNVSKVEALRQAQMELMKDEKYAHPFYWAPFILVGDWR